MDISEQIIPETDWFRHDFENFLKYNTKDYESFSKKIVYAPVILDKPREYCNARLFDYNIDLFGPGISLSVIAYPDLELKLPELSLTLAWETGHEYVLHEPTIEGNMLTFQLDRSLLHKKLLYPLFDLPDSLLTLEEVKKSINMSTTAKGRVYLRSNVPLDNAVCFYRYWEFYSQKEDHKYRIFMYG
jgi:hypothetical protein